MNWFQTTIKSEAKGGIIVLKLIVITTISFWAGVRIGVSNMDVFSALLVNIIAVLAVSGFWFFVTRIAPYQTI